MLLAFLTAAVGQASGDDHHGHRDQELPAGELTAQVEGSWTAAGAGPGTDAPEEDFQVLQALAVAPLPEGSGAEVYSLDSGSCRVRVYDGEGHLLRAFGECGGTGPGRLERPVALAVGLPARGEDLEVYLADFFLDRILIFDPRGTFLRAWGDGEAGPISPAGVAVVGGKVYVSEFYDHQIRVFTDQGTLQATWGGKGGGPGRFLYPAGLTGAADGSLYLADSHNHRIQRLAATGEPLGAWGTAGWWVGQLHDPVSVAVDGEGRMYVADSHNFRAQVLSPEGEYLGFWPLPGFPEGGEGEIQSPQAVALGPGGTLYVADAAGRRIFKLRWIQETHP